METRVEVDSSSPEQCQLEAEEPNNTSELTPEESPPEKDIMGEPLKTTTVSPGVSPCLEDFMGELSKTTNLSSEVSPSSKEMVREGVEPTPLSPEIPVSMQNMLVEAERTSPLSSEVPLCDTEMVREEVEPTPSSPEIPVSMQEMVRVGVEPTPSSPEIPVSMQEMVREEVEPTPSSPEIPVSMQEMVREGIEPTPLSPEISVSMQDNNELPEKSAPLSVANQDIAGGLSSPLVPGDSLENHLNAELPEKSPPISVANQDIPGGPENSFPLVPVVPLDNHLVGKQAETPPLSLEISLYQQLNAELPEKSPPISVADQDVPGGLENSSPLGPVVPLDNHAVSLSQQSVGKPEETPSPSLAISLYKQPTDVPEKFTSISAEITHFNQTIMEEKVKVSMGQSIKTFEKRHTVEVRASGTLVSTEVTLHKQLEGEPAKTLSLQSEVSLFQQMEEMEFPSRDAFISHARDIAERCGHGISILRSKDKCVYLKCDQGGEYRNWRNIEDDFRRRVTCTRLLNCPFRLKGNEVKGVWSLLISDTNHNHPLSENLIGHSRCRRMSDGQAETLKSLTKSGVKASEVLATIRSMDGSTPIAAKDVYNARNKTKLEEVDRLDSYLTELKTKFQLWPLDRRIAALSQLATLVYEPDAVVEPGQGGQPVQSVQSVQPVQPVHPVHPVHPAQSVQSVHSIQPVQLLLAGHSVQRGQMVHLRQAVQPVQPLQVVLAIQATPKRKMSKLKVRQVGEKNKRTDPTNETVFGTGQDEPPLKSRKCGVCGEFGHNRASCRCRKILNSV